jgi:hypothetical protein
MDEKTITRSFSMKLNLGGYQTADFFMAATGSPDQSTMLEGICYKEVVASVKRFADLWDKATEEVKEKKQRIVKLLPETLYQEQLEEFEPRDFVEDPDIVPPENN